MNPNPLSFGQYGKVVEFGSSAELLHFHRLCIAQYMVTLPVSALSECTVHTHTASGCVSVATDSRWCAQVITAIAQLIGGERHSAATLVCEVLKMVSVTAAMRCLLGASHTPYSQLNWGSCASAVLHSVCVSWSCVYSTRSTSDHIRTTAHLTRTMTRSHRGTLLSALTHLCSHSLRCNQAGLCRCVLYMCRCAQFGWLSSSLEVYADQSKHLVGSVSRYMPVVSVVVIVVVAVSLLAVIGGCWQLGCMRKLAEGLYVLQELC